MGLIGEIKLARIRDADHWQGGRGGRGMRTWLAGVWLLLVVLVTLGSTGPRTAAAQDEVRTSIGTLSDTQNVTARFVAIIAANGRAALYLVSDNPDWNSRYSRWFAG